MKLSITLALALTGACSAFALSPHNSLAALPRESSTHPAFVHPNRHHAVVDGSHALRATSSASTESAAFSSRDDTRQSLNVRGGGGFSLDVPLLTYFALWYLGNYYYNITNKLALKATGGAAGFPMTISALQLGIGSLYGIFLWLAPDARKKPEVTMDDVSQSWSKRTLYRTCGNVFFTKLFKILPDYV